MQANHVNDWEWQGKKYRFEVFLSADFSSLSNIRQVYGLVLNEDRSQILIVREKSGVWILPGGRIEPGETLIETLVREVKEETNRDVSVATAQPLFYQKVYQENERGEWDFIRTEVRYCVDIKSEHEFFEDPDHGTIVEARWIPITDLENYLDWGQTTKMIITLLS